MNDLLEKASMSAELEAQGQPDVAIPESIAARHHRYREEGWWPDQRLDDRYAGFVTERPDDLAAFAISKGLAKYLCPEVVRFIADMPRTAAGKIRKNELRDMVAESAGNPGSSNYGGKGR